MEERGKDIKNNTSTQQGTVFRKLCESDYKIFNNIVCFNISLNIVYFNISLNIVYFVFLLQTFECKD